MWNFQEKMVSLHKKKFRDLDAIVKVRNQLKIRMI